MGLPNSRQEAQKVMLLAGFLLSCVLQAAPAQHHSQISLTPEPSNALVGKDVKLSLKGAPQKFVQCQWFRQGHSGRAELILTNFGQSQTQQAKGHGFSGRVTLKDGCSLHIARLTQSDTGNYTVVIQVGPDQQTGQGQQPVGRNYSASHYLQVSSLLSITLNPQRPLQDQDITLTPQNFPREFHFCRWVIHTKGRAEKVLEYSREDSEQQSSSQGRATLRSDCSLHIGRLDISDTGNYTVEIESPWNQDQKPGQGTSPQEPEDFQVHKGQVYLDVLRQSGKYPSSPKLCTV